MDRNNDVFLSHVKQIKTKTKSANVEEAIAQIKAHTETRLEYSLRSVQLMGGMDLWQPSVVPGLVGREDHVGWEVRLERPSNDSKPRAGHGDVMNYGEIPSHDEEHREPRILEMHLQVLPTAVQQALKFRNTA